MSDGGCWYEHKGKNKSSSERDSNTRPQDLQSHALPSELSEDGDNKFVETYKKISQYQIVCFCCFDPSNVVFYVGARSENNLFGKCIIYIEKSGSFRNFPNARSLILSDGSLLDRHCPLLSNCCFIVIISCSPPIPLFTTTFFSFFTTCCCCCCLCYASETSTTDYNYYSYCSTKLLLLLLSPSLSCSLDFPFLFLSSLPCCLLRSAAALIALSLSFCFSVNTIRDFNFFVMAECCVFR